MNYIKFIKSGNLLEYFEYEKTPHVSRKKKINTGRKKSSSRRVDNVKRLKRQFVRIVRSNIEGVGVPVFFTFTMVEVVRIDVAYRLFTAFIQRFRKEFGADTRYIAVPEFQKRGAVHFHALIWGVPNLIVENEDSKVFETAEGVVSIKPTINDKESDNSIGNSPAVGRKFKTATNNPRKRII